jgi:hypothetical protein
MCLAGRIAAILAICNQWQTLIAGLLALAGAGWTVRSIRGQIAQTANLEQQRLKREERAAKAVLPLAVSELVQYALDCMKFLGPSATSDTAVSISSAIALPRIPNTILEPMQACARFAPPLVAAHIHRVLGAVQIQHARLETLVERALKREPHQISRIEGEGGILDAAELHAGCGALFLYAREAKPDQNSTIVRRLSEALFFAGIVGEDFPCLSAALKRRVTHPEFSLDWTGLFDCASSTSEPAS